jgi:flagellar hook assembly protein FlgD
MMRQMEVLDPTAVEPQVKVRGVQLGQSFPNPTSGLANIAFTLPARATVRLEVEDVAGRRIATLLEGSLDAGPHKVVWAGHGAGGEVVSPGVYFYRLIVNGESTAARQMVLLR